MLRPVNNYFGKGNPGFYIADGKPGIDGSGLSDLELRVSPCGPEFTVIGHVRPLQNIRAGIDRHGFYGFEIKVHSPFSRRENCLRADSSSFILLLTILARMQIARQSIPVRLTSSVARRANFALCFRPRLNWLRKNDSQSLAVQRPTVITHNTF
jgi:hypothetical protein